MKTNNSFSWVPIDHSSLKSLNVLAIGGTGGLGRALSRWYAQKGANVVVVGRTFRDQEWKNISFVQADLSSINDSCRLVEELDVSRFDLILFTAGIFAGGKREETKEGLERDMAVSFLNRLAMLQEMIPRLKSKFANIDSNTKLTCPRVFIMAYPGYDQKGNIDDLNLEKSYSAMKAHMNTVAGNEALVYDVNSKYSDRVHIYGLNPGIVKTNIRDNYLGKGSWLSSAVEYVIGWFSYTPEQYAQNIGPLLIAPELEGRQGSSYSNTGKELLRSKGFEDSAGYPMSYIRASEDLLARKGFKASL